jgi:hypothetical protein
VDGGDSAGGSQGLADLVDKYGGSLIADFERYYRPLPELLVSGRSPRYILGLIRQLPVESATVAELRGGSQFRGWDVDRYLLTAIVDAIQANTYMLAKANQGKPKMPEPMYRPEKAKPKNENSFAAMARGFYRAAQQKKE